MEYSRRAPAAPTRSRFCGSAFLSVWLRLQEADAFFDMGAEKAPSRPFAVLWAKGHLLQNWPQACITYRHTSWRLPHQRCASVPVAVVQESDVPVARQLIADALATFSNSVPTAPIASQSPMLHETMVSGLWSEGQSCTTQQLVLSLCSAARVCTGLLIVFIRSYSFDEALTFFQNWP